MEDSVAAGNDFQRVKNMWQNRVARTASQPTEERVHTAKIHSASVSAPITATSTVAKEFHLSIVQEPKAGNKKAAKKLEPATPHTPMTPAPDDDMPELPKHLVKEDPLDDVDNDSSSTSSPSSTAANSVMNTITTKLFRTASVDGSSCSSSATKDKENSASLMSISNLPVPDMSSWKEKMKSYGNKSTAKKLSFANLSSSWKSMSSMNIHTTNTGADASETTDPKQHVHCMYQKTRNNTTTAITSGSPYGELIVVEILAAKDLDLLGQDASDPYVAIRFHDVQRTTKSVTNTVHPVYNSRFVFWTPSSPSIEDQSVNVTVKKSKKKFSVNSNENSNDDHLGEVQLSLCMPVNESFDDWCPLMQVDGVKKGAVRVGMRRMVLTSPSLLKASQTLAAHNRCLNEADFTAYGKILPELWDSFTDAEGLVDDRVKQTDAIASKLNDLSRRFIGIELTASSESRRDVF